MKPWIRITLAVWSLLLPLTAPVLAQEHDDDGGKSLFVNLTSDEVNRARMAITLARRVLAEKKVPVTIWLNVEGVRLLDRDLLQPRYGDGRSGLEELEAFIKDGGTLLVCPMCLKNVGGLKPEDLPKGAALSEMDIFWETAFGSNVTVLSY